MKPKMTVLAGALLGVFMGSMAATSTSFAADCPADAICRDDRPGLYSNKGQYRVGRYNLSRQETSSGGATVYYPENAQPPFSTMVFCPPFTGTQIMYRAWGPFFASHGIVMVTMDSRSTMDTVDQRATQQASVLNRMKSENSNSRSPLYNKLDTTRMGATGWSMGGGATWINSGNYNGLRTAMSLAGHNISAVNRSSKGGNTNIPLLNINGATDITILGGLGQTEGVYRNAKGPKVMYVVATAGHMSWGGPTSGTKHSGELALAFQKTFLDGDLRWAQYVKRPSSNVSKFQSDGIPR